MTLKSRTRTWTLAALGLGQAFAPLALAQSPSTAPVIPTRAAAPQWSWQEKPGTERAWKLEYRGTAQVDYRLVASAMTKSLGTAKVADDQALTEAQTVTYAVDAVLHTRVLSVDASGWALACRLHDVRFLVDGAADTRRELFQAPFVARFDASGHLVGLEFMNKYPEALKRAVSRLVEPMQVVFGAPGATQWSSAEQGTDSAWAASYELTQLSGTRATLQKRKTAITRSALDQTEFSLPGEKRARIGTSKTTIAFDLEQHAVQRIDAVEQTSLEVGGARFTTDAHTFTAVAAPIPSDGLPTTLTAARETLADPAFAQARLYDVTCTPRRWCRGSTSRGPSPATAPTSPATSASACANSRRGCG